MLSVITSSLNQTGFVKRRCEADSRWLPPDFSECVSKDYQTLFDKVKQRSEKMGLYHSGIHHDFRSKRTATGPEFEHKLFLLQCYTSLTSKNGKKTSQICYFSEIDRRIKWLIVWSHLTIPIYYNLILNIQI